MRLFVAIVPPPAVLAELAAAVAPLRDEAPGLRWTGPESWHLTLAFLGEVADQARPELSTRLERAAGRHPAATVAITSAGAFPAPGRARVLWAGISAERRGLAALAASVAAGARRAGAPPPDEGRKYRPHLTLARSREPADVSALTDVLADYAGQAWTASQVCLISSQPGSGAPHYEQVGQWPLRPPAAAPARPAPAVTAAPVGAAGSADARNLTGPGQGKARPSREARGAGPVPG